MPSIKEAVEVWVKAYEFGLMKNSMIPKPEFHIAKLCLEDFAKQLDEQGWILAKKFVPLKITAKSLRNRKKRHTIPNRPKHMNRWTSMEIQTLLNLVEKGYKNERIGKIMGRTTRSIHCRKSIIKKSMKYNWREHA